MQWGFWRLSFNNDILIDCGVNCEGKVTIINVFYKLKGERTENWMV